MCDTPGRLSKPARLPPLSAELEHLPNATFQQADAQVHPFPDKQFDIVISRHGVMVFGDPLAAFANIARAMRPGARMVLLSWQSLERNEWTSSFRAALAAGRELPEPPDTDTQARALDNLRASMTDHMTDRGVYYDSAAWLIQAERR